MKNDTITKAKELIEIMKYFRTLKKVELPTGMKCPFDVEVEISKYDSLTHYDFSHAAVGTGYTSWSCPFCGKEECD